MKSLKEILKIRSNLLKYLRKMGNDKRSYNLIDVIILPSIKKSTDFTGKGFNREIEMDLSYITRDITKLEKQKLIVKKRIGKENIINLTRSGNFIAERLIKDNENFMKELYQKMGKEEVENAIKVIIEANRMIEEKITKNE